MNRVQIYNTLKTDSATSYRLSNSNADLTRLITANDVRRSPSKFVCLKLPNWGTTTTNQRGFYLNPTEFDTSPLVSDPNILVPKLLQNYLEHFNTLGRANTDTPDTFYDVLSEVGFWKMLNRTQSVNIALDGTEYIDGFDDNDGIGIVQYIGDINVVGHTKIDGVEYSELYLQVPHDAQRVKNARWKTFTPTIPYSRLPASGSGSTDATGLTASDGIIKALYDHDGTSTLDYYDLASGADKLQLDFENYDTELADFDYNCILMYYDVYHTSNPNVVTRKLGSVIFTEDFESVPSTSEFQIPATTKKIDSSGLTGNSIMYKFSSRFYYGNNNVNADTIINQHNTLSMELYMDVLNRMLGSVDLFNTQSGLIEELQARVSNLFSIVGTNTTYSELKTELDNLKLQVSQSQATGSISNEDLFEVFDTMVQNIGTGNGVSINNTFNFGGGSGGIATNLNSKYFGTNSSDETIGLYTQNSSLTRALFQNFIVSPVEFSSRINNNNLELTIDNNGSGLVTMYLDLDTNTITKGTYVDTSKTLEVNFAQNTTSPTHYIWYMSTTNGSTNAVPINTAIEAEFKNMIPIASFVLPTESEYTSNGLRSLNVFGNGNYTQYSDVHFDELSGSKIVKYADNSMLTVAIDTKRRILNPINVTSSNDSGNLQFSIDVDSSILNSITNIHTYSNISGYRQHTVPLVGKLGFADNVNSVTNFICIMQPASVGGGEELVFISLSEFKRRGVDSITNEEAIPLFLFTLFTETIYDSVNKVPIYPFTELRYTNTTNLVSGGGATDLVAVNTEISNRIVDNLTTNDGTQMLSAAQGVVLKGLIDGLSSGGGVTLTQVNSTISGRIVNNLTTSDSSQMLSAEQGVVLKGLIDSFGSGNLTTTDVNNTITGRIENTLTSNDSSRILSAAQGTVLDNKINGIQNSVSVETSVIRDTTNLISPNKIRRVNSTTLAVCCLGTGTTPTDSSIMFYDISIPEYPKLISVFTHAELVGAVDIIVKGTRMIVLSKWNGKIISLNISDIYNVTYLDDIGVTSLGSNFFSSGIAMHDDGSRVYVAYSDGRIIEYDITNMAALSQTTIINNITGNINPNGTLGDFSNGELTDIIWYKGIIYTCGSNHGSNGTIYTLFASNTLTYNGDYVSAITEPSRLLHDGTHLRSISFSRKEYTVYTHTTLTNFDVEITNTVGDFDPKDFIYDYSRGVVFVTCGRVGVETRLHSFNAIGNTDLTTKGFIANSFFVDSTSSVLVGDFIYTCSSDSFTILTHALRVNESAYINS